MNAANENNVWTAIVAFENGTVTTDMIRNLTADDNAIYAEETHIIMTRIAMEIAGEKALTADSPAMVALLDARYNGAVAAHNAALAA